MSDRPESGGLDLRLLGPLEVRRDGENLSLGGRTPRRLLAKLLTNDNLVVSQQVLLDEVWGEAKGGTVGNLQAVVSNLRGSLGLDGSAEPARIEKRSGGYILVVDPGRVDYRRFQRHCLAGDLARAAGDAASAAVNYAFAETEWHGPHCLQDVADDGAQFATSFGAAVEGEALVVAERLAEAQLALGQQHLVLRDLRLKVQRWPASARLCRYLVTALAQGAQIEEAESIYRAFLNEGAEQDIEAAGLRAAWAALIRGEQPPSHYDGGAPMRVVPLNVAGTVIDGEDSGLRAELSGPFGIQELSGARFIIGRKRDECDLVLDDGRVSRTHAAITPATEGFELQDLNSANGTFLDGVKLDGSRGRVPLPALAQITVGSTSLTFRQLPA